MFRNFKYELNQRLIYSKECASYYSNYLKHLEINEKINNRTFFQNSFILIFKKFYYLPIITLKYFNKMKAIKAYSIALKEIEVLEEELKKHN